MNILILGNGGREHAFAWKIAQSPKLSKLFIAPGNAGTSQHGVNVDIDPMDFEQIGKFCNEENIEMVIVGPEAPLVAGIADYFAEEESLRSIAVIGPSAEGAQLEGSKAFAKRFMQEYGIPTAAYGEFTLETLSEGKAFIETQTPPIVLKADGLAAGKGVLIIEDREEAKEALEKMLKGQFGAASSKVVIEDFLKGIEFSVFVVTDGLSFRILPAAKDYKRIGEGDTGLNTGGMGAVSPVPFIDASLMEKVVERIVKPTIRGIAERGMKYQGFVFLGLINVGGEPKVIEYNCRMGDPETEVVFPRLKSDLLEMLIALVEGNLSSFDVEFSEDTATTIMLVSGGYPGSYEKGKIIKGLEKVQDCEVFHAGTAQSGNEVLTNGGRVIAVTALAPTMEDAINISRANAEIIQFERKYFRTDIGFDL